MNPTIEKERQIKEHNELIKTINMLAAKIESLEKEVAKLTKKQLKE